MDTKVCNTCFFPQPLSNYYRKKTNKDNLDHRCKGCCRKKDAEKSNDYANRIMEDVDEGDY